MIQLEKIKSSSSLTQLNKLYTCRMRLTRHRHSGGRSWTL